MNFIQNTIYLYRNIWWNPITSANEENNRWSLLRAIEWGNWPAFLSIPIVPAFLPFFDWWKIIGAFAILTLLWSFVRYKFVNIKLAELAIFLVLLKWITCPLSVIYLIIQHKYILSGLSLLWPWLASTLGMLIGPTQFGIIQQMFMAKLGYLPVDNILDD